MVYEWREQPWFGLYVSYQIITTSLFRLPYWCIISYPQSWRPRASWTIKRSVLVRLFRHLYNVMQRTGAFTSFPTHRALAPGPGVKGVWVPATPHLVAGPLLTLAFAAQIRPAHIPGYWIDRDPALPAGTPARPDELVLYRLHGSGYIQLSAHPTDPTANITRGILKACSAVARTFAVEYRLSSGAPYEPEHPFPAALLDALAGYAYLVHDLAFDPAKIIIVGDSAGANLALALVRYLRDLAGVRLSGSRSELPELPGGMVLLSPWADLSRSHDGVNTSLEQCFASDFTGSRAGVRTSYAKRAFLGPLGLGFAETSALISPASLNPWIDARFGGFPRTLICAGGAEPLLDSIRTLFWKMERDMGLGEDRGRVSYYQAPDALHDHLIFPWHEPENGQALKRIAEWIDRGWRDP